tara:strand:- start:64 stop:798 length:735 start_codon:yes stop_codon:yes gene_type:complete
MKTVIIIPSRMSAQRLKGKPLLKINDLPIICHVVKKAKESEIGDVYVATEDEEIANVVKENNGKAILTGIHKTGTDRIFEALEKAKLNDADFILNLQGDEPNIDPLDLINLNNIMIKNNLNVGTLASEIKEKDVYHNQNIVKVITEDKLRNNNFSKAVNFLRKNLNNSVSNVYHHIGVYCYKISILQKFVNLNQTKNEIDNKLEQLRLLDNKIDINVSIANSTPIGIDTEEDYLELKKKLEYKS